MVQGAGDHENGPGALPSVGDQLARRKGVKLPIGKGEVCEVERDGVSASEWFKGMLGASDELEVGGDHG